MKKVSGSLRLNLAQYRELEAFAAFVSDLDRASRAQLERGARLVELLKQSNYSPYPVQEQVVSVWAGTEGKLDDIPVGEVRRFESEFLQYLRHKHEGVLAAIAGHQWNDEIIGSLDSAITEFKQLFLGKEEERRINEPPAKPLEGEESRETVTRYADDTAEKQ
jgi:F-type H+/Na+-transporting ATPase subunit alpha